MPRLEPIQILKLLPQTNCKECGEITCLAFAAKVGARDLELKECKPLFEDPNYTEKRIQLVELLTPPIRSIKFGPALTQKKIGGEEVLHRHELTFHTPSKLLVTLEDSMDKTLFLKELERLEKLVFTRIGKDLKIDGFCLRCTSKNPEEFKQRVKMARTKTKLPFCLASLDPAIIQAALEVEETNRPLIYAATIENWQEMMALAQKYDVPIVIASNNGNLDDIATLAETFSSIGIDVVLDPGTWINQGWMGKGFRNKIELRRAAITGDNKTIGFPILSIPAVTQLFLKSGKPDAKYFKESLLSSILMEKYADIMILSPSPHLWSIMPILTFRQSIYSDPRIHPTVDPGIYSINMPDKESPVCVSTNFALTYFTIRSDFEGQKLGTWLLVVDTGGLGVEAAAAGGQLTTDKIIELMVQTKIDEKVTHRTLILPGLAARLSGELEDVSGWKVLVGPRDSADIKKIYDKWTV